MIEKAITEKVLLVGPDCNTPKGGIGMVTHSYKQLFPVFNYLTTQREGSALRKILVFGGALLKLFSYLVGRKIQIVHVHGASKGSFYRKSIVIILSKLAGKRVVYHIHGGAFKDFTRKHPRTVPYILKKCDTIVSLSDSWSTFFSHDIGCSDVKVVPNIMDVPHEDHSLRDKNYCTILFLGKICREKGIFDLMDAIIAHQDEYKGRLRFYIAGIGESDRLNGLISSHHLEGLVTYFGWVDGLKKERLLNESDIFILPSYYEGVPISILEAFSYHLPAIASNVGGIPEILSEGIEGVIIPPGDTEKLHEAITLLAQSPSLRFKMGEFAYERSLSHLPCNIEKCLTNVYRPLLRP